MGGFAFRTERCAAANTEEGIVDWIGGDGVLDRFQPSGRTPAIGEHKPLAFPDAAEDAFGVISEVQHGDGLHYVDV
jgi:hypothetical protein